MGSITDVLTVALGSGGATSVLAQTIKTWLSTRRSDVRIKIETGSRTLEIEARPGDENEVRKLVELLLTDLADEPVSGIEQQDGSID